MNKVRLLEYFEEVIYNTLISQHSIRRMRIPNYSAQAQVLLQYRRTTTTVCEQDMEQTQPLKYL